MHTQTRSPMRTAPPRLQRSLMVCGLAAGLALTACPKPDERVAPLEARVTALETELKTIQADLEALRALKATPIERPAPVPTTMPLMSNISAPFEALGFTIGELSADELAAGRAPDGFALIRNSFPPGAPSGKSPRQRLLVLGSLVATPSDARSLLGDNMNSFSVVLDARIVDEKTREVKATVRKQVQVLGVSPEVAFQMQKNKQQAITTALADEFAAKTGKR